MGYFEQYDDIKAYDLVKIVIAHQYQNQGIGTELMLEVEKRIKEAGGAMIQLQAVKDEMHERLVKDFYYLMRDEYLRGKKYGTYNRTFYRGQNRGCPRI